MKKKQTQFDNWALIISLEIEKKKNEGKKRKEAKKTTTYKLYKIIKMNLDFF